MKTTAIIVLILIAAALGVRHYSSAPHKAAPARAPVSSPAAPSQPQEVVANTPPPQETAALPGPQRHSALPAEPPPVHANDQELSGRIHELQEQLRELNQAHDETMVNAQNYQASLQQQNAAAAGDIERQIQDTNSTIVELQNQLNGMRTTATVDVASQATQSQRLETQIANQKTVLGQLRSQRRQLNDNAQAAAAAGNRELVIETDQMRLQRTDLERQLHDLEAQRVSHR